MASELAVALAATLVEDEDFVTLHEWGDDLENYFCSFYCWSSYFDFSVVVYQQHFFNLNSCVGFYVLDVVDVELLALFCFELLTLNFCNYVHCFVIMFLGLDR